MPRASSSAARSAGTPRSVKEEGRVVEDKEESLTVWVSHHSRDERSRRWEAGVEHRCGLTTRHQDRGKTGRSLCLEPTASRVEAWNPDGIAACDLRLSQR